MSGIRRSPSGRIEIPEADRGVNSGLAPRRPLAGTLGQMPAPLRMAAAAALLAMLAAACTSDSAGPQRATPFVAAQATATTPPATRCAPPYPAGPPLAETVACADPAAMQPAAVVRIIDGDTFEVTRGGAPDTVRIYGIDTPERGEPCFREASIRLGALAGDAVRLAPGARERDRFGRLLRYVYTPDGASIDAALVAEGLARAWRDDGDLRFALIELEDRARTSGAGCLWR
jgi:endonuclease YncB( thermonuclease family)